MSPPQAITDRRNSPTLTADSGCTVSVCIPVHNGERFVRAALDGVRAQTHPLHEIIICDDASTDGTAAILAELASVDKRIRVLTNARNVGGFDAYNRAVGEASGDLIAMYHADDVYGPQIVEREAGYLASHPDACAVFCLDNMIDEAGRDLGRVELPTALAGRTSFDSAALTDAMLRYKNCFLRAPSAMFRRAAFEQLGGFDQARYGVEADVDMWLRLSTVGRIGLIREHLFSYRLHSGQWSRRYHALRSTRELFFQMMDRHLSRPGVRAAASPEALTLYRIWQVQDETECAANALMLGDRHRARALLNTSLVRPLLSSPQRLRVARILALKLVVLAAAAAGGGRYARAAVYAARFRRRPPRNFSAPPDSVAWSVDAGSDTAVTERSSAARARRPLRIFLDPFSYHFLGNSIFDPLSKFNRDGAQRPWFYLRQRAAERGFSLDTADYLDDVRAGTAVNIYASFGIHDRYVNLSKRDDVVLNSFYVFEAPLHEPALYRKLPDLSRHFRSVYSWADKSDLAALAQESFKVEPFRIPMPFEEVIEPYWSRMDRDGILLVNTNRRGTPVKGELFTERLQALDHFATHGGIELWGRGWETILEEDRQFGDAIRRSWRGPLADKYEAYARAKFVVCYENMVMRGWLTEKIFDCFYTGAVPIYLGAPDIAEWVSAECFVDVRDFASYDELGRYLDSLAPADLQRYREAARDYLASKRFRPFTAGAFADRFLEDISAQLAERGLAELPR